MCRTSALTHSGMLRSEILSMSRLACSSCTTRMTQTVVMVNQPKMCGTRRRAQAPQAPVARATGSTSTGCCGFLASKSVRPLDHSVCERSASAERSGLSSSTYALGRAKYSVRKP